MRRRDRGFSKRDGLETKKWFKEKRHLAFKERKMFNRERQMASKDRDWTVRQREGFHKKRKIWKRQEIRNEQEREDR